MLGSKIDVSRRLAESRRSLRSQCRVLTGVFLVLGVLFGGAHADAQGSLPGRPEADPVSLSLAARPEGDPVSLAARPEGDPVSLAARPEGDPVSLAARPEGDPVSLAGRPEGDPVSLAGRPEGDPVSLAGRPEGDPRQRHAGVDPALAARWRALSPEARAELERRFDELRALPPAEREALVRRARELERLERDVLVELSGSQQERLDALTVEARRRVLRDLALDRARERAEHLRAVVPAEHLAALERGDHAQRERARGALRRQHEQELPQRVRRVAEELALPPHEVERLVGQPPELQRVALYELTRQRMARWIERNGLPAGIDTETWQRLRQAPPEVFARHYARLRERFEGLAHSPGAGGDGERRSGGGSPWARGGRPSSGAADERTRVEGRSPERRGSVGAPTGPDRAPAGVDPDVRVWLMRLRAAGHPTTEERLELAELPPQQRGRVLGERVRARVLGVLRESGVDAAKLQRIAALPPVRFRKAAFEALHAQLGVPLPPEPAQTKRERRGR